MSPVNLASALVVAVAGLVGWSIPSASPAPIEVRAHFVTQCGVELVHVRPVGLLNEP